MLDPEKYKIIIDYLQPYDPVKIGIFGSRPSLYFSWSGLSVNYQN
jgi:hypothetical protein